ncbi:hypothetical protein CDEST_14574 [Colletotrichum destructivum]|uniref:Uncharacterized protein n=1 Tax=Colletotrichum destructivum TaxID=34406 RepID=A0AAX4J2A7_9PEZI|nr:hypothetical protein CDEST_14574 [Colletotrichum destructivum]
MPRPTPSPQWTCQTSGTTRGRTVIARSHEPWNPVGIPNGICLPDCQLSISPLQPRSANNQRLMAESIASANMLRTDSTCICKNNQDRSKH